MPFKRPRGPEPVIYTPPISTAIGIREFSRFLTDPEGEVLDLGSRLGSVILQPAAEIVPFGDSLLLEVVRTEDEESLGLRVERPGTFRRFSHWVTRREVTLKGTAYYKDPIPGQIPEMTPITEETLK